MNKIILSTLVLFLSISCFSQKLTKDEIAIKKLIEDYKVSISKADALLGVKVWTSVPEVSFIHPRTRVLTII